MSHLNPMMFLQQPRLDKHPFVLLAFNYVVGGLCVNVVPPTKSARAAAVIAFAALQLFFFHHVKLNQIRPSYQAFWAYTIVAQILYSTHFIYILRISPPPAADTWWKKAWWAWRESINPRGIGTAWQIKNTPAFEIGGKTWSGSRVQFVAMRLCGFCMKYYSSIAFGNLTRLLRLKNDDFLASKIPLLTRLSEVDGRELVVRLYIPFKIWASMYFDHSAMHSLVSAIAVACGDDPSSWPPMYGDLSEVYLVRRYFGFFWQRLIYKGFTANASLITANVFRIPRGSEAGKWMVTFLSFLLSGILHVVAFKMVMITRDPMPIFKWWLQTGLTILLEDLVIKGYAYLGCGGRTKTKWWWRGLGYVWVWLYFAWSCPATIYRQ